MPTSASKHLTIFGLNKCVSLSDSRDCFACQSLKIQHIDYSVNYTLKLSIKQYKTVGLLSSGVQYNLTSIM